MYRLLYVYAVVTVTLVSLVDSKTCLHARNRCISRIGCSMALNNFLIACEPVRLGLVDHCTDSCMRAVISLVTVDDDIGTDILTCDCDSSVDCITIRDRISMCSDGVLKALETLDNEEVISCSLSRMLCEASTKCFTALSYYEENCSDLWASHTNSLTCSAKCNNSVSILFRQPRAAKLKNCMCDNTDPIIDEARCIRMRYNTAMYCLKEEPRWPVFVVADHKKEAKYESYSKPVISKTTAFTSSAADNGTSYLILTLLILTIKLVEMS